MESSGLKSYFMPSELARLVLGYLKENNYVNTYKCFLKECVHLTEYLAALKNGREYATTIMGLSLILILEDYGKIKLAEGTVKTSDNIRHQPKTFISGVSQNSRMRKQLSYASRVSPIESSGISHPVQQPQTSTEPIAATSEPLQTAGTESVTGDGDRRQDSDNDDFTIEIVGCDGDATTTEPSKPTGKTITSETNVSGELVLPEVVKVSHSERVKRSVTEITETEIETDVTKVDICGGKDKEKLPDKHKSTKIPVKTKMSVNKTNKPLSEKQYLKASAEKKSVENNSETDSSKHEPDVNSNHPSTSEDIHAPSDCILSDLTHKTVTECASTKKAKNEIIKKSNRDKSHSKRSSECAETVRTVCYTRASSIDSVKVIPDDGSETGSTKSSESSKSPRSSGKERSNLVDLDGNTCDAWASCHPGIKDGDKILDKLELKPPDPNSEIARPSDKEISDQLNTPRKKKEGTSSASSNLVTPMKLADSIKSPRRKKPKTPRKRPDVAPVATSDDVGDPMFQKVLNDTKLIEKLTETCNIVNEKVKLSTSNKDAPPCQETTHTSQRHSEGPPDIVTGSKSLEEILDMDNNFTAELSSNIDMSDPAFASLFKLFGTDKEAFLDETARKEQDHEAEQATAALTAVVEELERSIHEIACGSVQMSQKDEGYETQRTQCLDSVVSSPHTSPAGLHISHTTTPSRSHPASPYVHCYSPAANIDTHVSSPVLCGSEGVNSMAATPSRSHNNSYLSQSGVSAAIHETQPFSPVGPHTGNGHSLNFSASTPIASPATPQSIEHCSENFGHGAVPESPFNCHSVVADTLSPGHMTGYGTPHRQAHTPIPPSPLMVDSTAITADYCVETVRGSQTGSYTPASRRNILAPTHNQQVFTSPDHYQYSPGPPTTQAESHLAPPIPASTPTLDVATTITSQTHQSINQQSVNYMSFVTDVMSSGESSSTPIVDRAVSTFASTIDNTIDCISLPPSTSAAPDMLPPVGEAGKSKSKRNKAGDRQLLKKTVVSNANNQRFTELRTLLSKPSQNEMPLSEPSTPALSMSGCQTPERTLNGLDNGENEIMILSPGGNSCFKIPILGCQDENEIDQAVASIGRDMEGGTQNETVKLWTPNLNSSTEFTVAGENDSFHQITSPDPQQPALVDGIQPALDTLPPTFIIFPETTTISETEIENGSKRRKSKKEKAGPKRTYTKKGKTSQKDKTKKNEVCQPTQTADADVHPLLKDDANEILIATPLNLTPLHKTFHVRTLNFGPVTTDVPSKKTKAKNTTQSDKKRSNFSNATKTRNNLKVHLPIVHSETIDNTNVTDPASTLPSVTMVDILSIKSIDTGQYLKIAPKPAFAISSEPHRDAIIAVNNDCPSNKLLNNNNDELQQELETGQVLELNESSRSESGTEIVNASSCKLIDDVNNKQLTCVKDAVVYVDKCHLSLTGQSSDGDATKLKAKKCDNKIKITKVKSPKLNVKKSKVNYCPQNSKQDCNVETTDDHVNKGKKKRSVSKSRSHQKRDDKALKEERGEQSQYPVSPVNKTVPKKKRGKDKIKIKFVNKKETVEKNMTTSVKLKPALKLNKHIGPQKASNRKSAKKSKAFVDPGTESGTSEEYVPLCQLKGKLKANLNGTNGADKKLSTVGKGCPKDNVKETDKDYTTKIMFSQPSGASSQASQQEASKSDNQDISEEILRTPEKKHISRANDSDEDLFTPSKQSVFEKLGLTPKKDAVERAEKFQSPIRGNILDYLAAIRNTPKSARLRSPSYLRKQVSSPLTPKQKTPGKRLFASDNDKGIKSPAKKKTPMKTTVCSETSSALTSQTNNASKLKCHTKKLFAVERNASVKKISNKQKKVTGKNNKHVNKCKNAENSDIVKSAKTGNIDEEKHKPVSLKLVHTIAETPKASGLENVKNVTYTVSPSKVPDKNSELADGDIHCKLGEPQETGIANNNLAMNSKTIKHKKERKPRCKSQKQSKEKSEKVKSNNQECGIKVHVKFSDDHGWKTVNAGCTADKESTPSLRSCEKQDTCTAVINETKVPNERNSVSNDQDEARNEKCVQEVDNQMYSAKIQPSSGDKGKIIKSEIVRNTSAGQQKTTTKQYHFSVKSASRPMHAVKGTTVRTDSHPVGKLLTSPAKAEIRANARPDDKDTATAGGKGLTKDTQKYQQGEGIKAGTKRKCDDTDPIEQKEHKKLKSSVDMSKLSLDIKNLDVMKALSQIYNI